MSVAVEKAYMLITTRCNDRCRYCIIRKTDEHMDERTVREGLELVFSTAGHVKQVAIYGGEPLVRFDLVRKVIEHTKRLVADTGKAGRLFIYTNGFELDDSRIEYFKRENVSLILSLDVCQELKPAEHRSSHHVETFPVKVRNLARALAVLEPEGVCGAAVLLPEDVGMLLPEVCYLHEALDLRVIKILPGLGRYHWSESEITALDAELARLETYLLQRVRSGKPLYIDMINESLARCAEPAQDAVVPISVMEIYPNRRFGLSPCEFETPPDVAYLNDTSRYCLGSLDETDLDTIAERARGLDREPRHSGLRHLSGWTESMARRLRALSSEEQRIRRYVEQARELRFA